MKCLTIQLQPHLDTTFNEQDLIYWVRDAGRSPEIDIINEDGYWVNLNFFSENLPLLWADLESVFKSQVELGHWVSRVAIIACEGEQGWDDYRLLSHYDKNEPIQGLED